MTSEKKLLRSRKALLGGVCAGVADYFSVDPVVVRILAVAFAFASAGLLVVAYGALWVLLPLEPKEAVPLDIEPQAVHSETYGAVDVESSRRGDTASNGTRAAVQAASWQYVHPSYTSAAHVPPEPPAGAQRQTPATPPSWSPSQADGGFPADARQTAQPAEGASTSGVKAALFAGSFLLFFGVSALIASMVEGISWWQYWPLIFVILGIVRMVIPGTAGYRMRKFVDGLMVFCAGSTLLAMSLGAVGWGSLELMLVSLWPLLLMVAGLLLLGGALKSSVMTLLAGVCFAAFCVIGLLWYAVPGPTEELVISAPYGREYHFDMRPWGDIEWNEEVVISIAL